MVLGTAPAEPAAQEGGPATALGEFITAIKEQIKHAETT